MNKKFLIALSAVVALTGTAFALTKDSIYLPAATDELIKSFVSGDTVSRFNLNSDGDLEWGNGSDAVDTNLYRSAANTLTTDDALTVTGALTSGAIAATSAVLTGDLSGDGGDQFFGFLQDQVASTTVAVTAAQAGKTFVSNSADVMTLPEASTVLGARYTFVCGTADDFDINPADGTDQIGTVASITGTNTTTVLAPSAGDAVRCTDIGSSITLEAVGANLWASIGTANGIWTDVN